MSTRFIVIVIITLPSLIFSFNMLRFYAGLNGRIRSLPDQHYSSVSRYIALSSFSTKNSFASLHGERMHGIENYKITIVDDIRKAKIALQALESHPNHTWACDTEVADIDLKTKGPVGNGKVICFSIFGGMDIDFGNGPGSALWVQSETDDDPVNSNNILKIFKSWFENPNYKKVWHNYGFDRHVMYNEGINCLGFAGDTMHMARLWDSSRDKTTGGKEGYSLQSLSEYFTRDNKNLEKVASKISMTELFGVGKLKKDGTEGKVLELPDVRELQNNPATRLKWIEYSAKDSVATWLLSRKLEIALSEMKWIIEGKVVGDMLQFYNKYLVNFGELLTDMERNGIKVDTEGHLKNAEKLARSELQRMQTMFIDWAGNYCKDIKYLNVGSASQIGQLFYGEYENWELTSDGREKIFSVDKEQDTYQLELAEAIQLNPYCTKTSTELKELLKTAQLSCSGNKSDLIVRLLWNDLKIERLGHLGENELVSMCSARGLDLTPFLHSDESDFWLLKSKKTRQKKIVGSVANIESLESKISVADMRRTYLMDLFWNSEMQVETLRNTIEKKASVEMPKKYRDIVVKSIGLTPTDFTPLGTPQVSAAVLKKLAGKDLFGDEKDATWGAAYDFFGRGDSGAAACRAIGALAAAGQLESTITNFLVPLQALVDKNSRIHCSLNLNTETGRLSSRRPNLQNQPALEKDQFKIRDAFIAEEGNTFIVADYGQLELRLLAHITNCKSMIDAFASGGCFHSRTALGMYDHIKQAVKTGEVLLEWDYSKGKPTAPLVKDKFASERRKAKTLNFSIAYGKTAHGLAQDWNITPDEAKITLNAWYNDRPEVRRWQEDTQYHAKKFQNVRTMLGRYRMLPAAKMKGPAQSHALRAAINTPVQGSAADVVMLAMIKLWKSEVLKRLGWKLLLQIHDEVILEGPKESSKEAMDEVNQCMRYPFDGFGIDTLKVALDVDAKSADSWYKAK